MKTCLIGFTAFLLTALNCEPAGAWAHASGNSSSWSASDSRGGSASGGDGSWSGTGARGGTASGGDGSWSGKSADGGTASGGGGSWNANGAYGGTASGGDGSWHATGADGTTAYGGNNVYYGGAYNTYHPPVVVNSYSEGCDDCGGWSAAGAAAVGLAAGAAVGMAAGAADANAAATTATTNAYDAGVATGMAAGGGNNMGAIYTSLPPTGCVASTHDNTKLFNCGGVWFLPGYGANGVFYRVVPAPAP